jgi:Rad3-related DNA helicase
MSLIEFFPPQKTPYDEQIFAVNEIAHAISIGKKYIVLRAPTGAGKSWIAKTVANSSKEIDPYLRSMIENGQAFEFNGNSGEYIYADTFNNAEEFGASILTVSKQLQEQYNNDFDDIVVMKGKGNYVCEVDFSFMCDFAPCHMNSSLLADCKLHKKCPFLNQRELAAKSKITTFNYASFFAFPKHLRRREYIIFDEATELEKQLVSTFSLNIDKKILRQNDVDVVTFPTTENLNCWINDLLIKSETAMSDVVTKMKLEKKPNSKDITKHRFLSNYCNDIKNVVQHIHNTEYLVSKISDDVCVVEPLRVDSFAQEIFSESKTIIFMGATIIDYEAFIKPLGLTKNDVYFIDTPSTFPPEKSPIMFCDHMYLNNSNLDTMLPKIVKIIDMCASKHSDEKGLIHSHSFKITKYLQTHLKGSRFLFRNDNANNIMLLLEHMETKKATVVVSPSLTHGADFKDDSGRFQVVIKAPYLPLTNERVKRIAKENPEWYQLEMLSTFMQACGRCTRSMHDYSTTYVIDSVIAKTIAKYKDKLPRYFLDRIK